MRVSQGFSKNGVSVSMTASTTMRVDIPTVGVSVTFDGQVFQVQLSYSHFSHNTEGQCGERETQALQGATCSSLRFRLGPPGGISTPEICTPPPCPRRLPQARAASHSATRFLTEWPPGGGGEGHPAMTLPAPPPGTCTNSKTDDCRLPDGTIAPTCQDMASAWLVPETNKEGCWAPTGPPATTSPPSPAPTTPTSTPCPAAPLCELMLSQ